MFVELPLTGTTAISNELRRNYAGRPILKKHSTYTTFLRQASQEERDYFAFSCIRHPMDTIVSHYFKLKTDHFDFEDPEKLKKRSLLNRFVYQRLYLDQLKFIRASDADFASYFLKFYKRPYSNWAVLSHHEMDFLIRFENLQSDFETALRRIGIEPVRELPMHNKTRARAKSFADYYTGACVPRAKSVFKCFMEEWGFEFPPGFGDVEISTVDRFHYQFLNIMRKAYWTNLKQGR